MSQRQVLVPALDVGHRSFKSFLDERLCDLKSDLLRECERIANARELLLKDKLNDLRRQNEELQAEFEILSKRAADAGLQCGKDQESQEEATLTSSTQHRAKDEYYQLWGEWLGNLGSQNDHHTTIENTIESERIEGFDEDEQEEEFAWVQELGHDPEKLAPSPFTVNPNSARATIWEFLGVPLLFYDLFLIPMQVFYKSEGPVSTVIGWIIILYWTCDIFVRLLVLGYVNQFGIIKLERKLMMKNYLRRSFAFDFLMVAPDWFSKIIGAGVGVRNVAILRLFRILRLMRLMRMGKMKKIMRNVEDLIDSEYFSVACSIAVNLFAILGTCHYFGCFWFWLGTMELDGERSWVEENAQLRKADWSYQYVVSLHWAVAQFTPGPTRIQPVNLIETIYSIAVLVFGLVFLSLFISALAQARQRLQAITSKIDRDNWMLRRYLRQQGVSSDLQVRTMKYVETCLEPMMLRVQRKDVSLLPLLSRPLQLEVQEEHFFYTLRGHPLFKRFRERSVSLTLHLFVNVIVEILLAGSDLLFDAGSISHEMYFVSRGALAYLVHGSDHLQYIDTCSWCSEPVIWTPWVHNGTAKATVESHVISIDSARFRSTALEHKERSFIMRCARAYLKDLNSRLDSGVAINDMTTITSDDSSEYVRAIFFRGRSSSTLSEAVAAQVSKEAAALHSI